MGAPAFIDALLPWLQNYGLTRMGARMGTHGHECGGGAGLVYDEGRALIAGTPTAPEAVARDVAENRAWYEAIYPLVAERAKTMAEVVPMIAYLFSGDTVLLDERSVEKCLRVDGASRALERVCSLLAEPALDWEAASIEAALRTVPEELAAKPKLVFQAVRVAVCGNMVSPPLFESLDLLGREHSLARITRAQKLTA
jgi:glutamyl-tRNA synthetase